MITKKKANQTTKKQDAIYRYIKTDEAFVYLGVCFLLSFIFGSIFWFNVIDNHQSSVFDNHQSSVFDNHGCSIWLLGLFFFIVLELIYYWLCKNDYKMKKSDILEKKLISGVLSLMVFAFVIPLLYFLKEIVIRIVGFIDQALRYIGTNFITVIYTLAQYVAIICLIVIGIWLFYRLNVWVYKQTR